MVDAQSGNDVQSLLILHSETLSSQHGVINSIREARSGLHVEIKQSKQLAANSAGVIPASKAQQDSVQSARSNGACQPPHPSFQPGSYKHRYHHGNRGHGFLGGFTYYQSHHSAHQQCRNRNRRCNLQNGVISYTNESPSYAGILL